MSILSQLSPANRISELPISASRFGRLSPMSRRPDFIVVGAPKCGTTSIHSYLSQSPYVYSPRKDLDYFGSDLAFSLPTPTREEYEQHFAPAGRLVTGDVSVWYLYSKRAPSEIREYVPAARIVIMLRNPVDFMHSMHRQAIFQNDESVASFEEALELENQRQQGKALPVGAYAGHAVFYRDLARFSQQIKRYLRHFPREQVHFIILDDLAKDPPHEWSRLCTFLEIPDSGVSSFSIANPHKRQRSPGIANTVSYFRRSLVPRLGLERSPDRLKSIGKGALRLAQRWNTEYVERSSMDPALRAALLVEFEEEITALEQILNRNLSDWRR